MRKLIIRCLQLQLERITNVSMKTPTSSDWFLKVFLFSSQTCFDSRMEWHLNDELDIDGEEILPTPLNKCLELSLSSYLPLSSSIKINI